MEFHIRQVKCYSLPHQIPKRTQADIIYSLAHRHLEVVSSPVLVLHNSTSRQSWSRKTHLTASHCEKPCCHRDRGITRRHCAAVTRSGWKDVQKRNGATGEKKWHTWISNHYLTAGWENGEDKGRLNAMTRRLSQKPALEPVISSCQHTMKDRLMTQSKATSSYMMHNIVE